MYLKTYEEEQKTYETLVIIIYCKENKKNDGFMFYKIFYVLWCILCYRFENKSVYDGE